MKSKYGEITNDIDLLEDNQDYILVKDSFLSNFMGMDIISFVALPVDNADMEDIVKDNIDNRSDWHYIDTQSGKTIKQDYSSDDRFNIKIKSKSNADRMYRKGGFS